MLTKEEISKLSDLVHDEISRERDATFYRAEPEVAHLWAIVHKLSDMLEATGSEREIHR